MSQLHLTTNTGVPMDSGLPGAIEPKTRCWMIWPERTDEYPFGAPAGAEGLCPRRGPESPRAIPSRCVCLPASSKMARAMLPAARFG